MCVCVCVCVCVSVCVIIILSHVYTCIYMYIHVYTCICVNMKVYVHTCPPHLNFVNLFINDTVNLHVETTLHACILYAHVC